MADSANKRSQRGADQARPTSGSGPLGDYAFPTARGVLTAAEIEALLRPDTANLPALPQDPSDIVTRRMDELVADPGQTGLETRRRQAAQLAARLSLALARNAGFKAAVTLDDVALTDRQTLMGLLDGKAAAVACLGKNEFEIEALICLPATLADALIATACGAPVPNTGRPDTDWSLSAIDCALLEQLIAPLASALDPDLKLQAVETDISYVTSVLADGRVALSEFGVETRGVRSELAIIQGIDGGERSSELPARAEGPPVTAVVTARLARLSVPLSKLTALKAGSTLLLGLPPDQPVQILSGGRDGEVAFEGQIGRKGKRMAVRITSSSPNFRSRRGD